jgi:hypothetical protein
MSLRHLSLAASVLLCGFTLAAAASPIKYDVTLTSTGGQTVNGYFDYDSSLPSYLEITGYSFNMSGLTNEITTNGVAGGVALNAITLDPSDTHFSPSGDPWDLTFANSNDSVQLTIAFTGFPGTLDTHYSQFYITDQDGGIAGLNFATGSAVAAVPEPPTGLLTLTGGLLLLAGLTWYERRNLAAASLEVPAP